MTVTDTWEPAEHDGSRRLPPGSSGIEVRWALRDGRSVVIKRAMGRGRARLRREAVILAEVRGPGLVQLIGIEDADEHTDLVLADAGDHTLADPAGVPTEILRRALVSTCASIGEMHRLGWAHGGIEAQHIVLNRRGRSRLCSLGSAVSLAADPGARDRDLLALSHLVDRCAHGPVATSTWSDRLRWRWTRHRLINVVSRFAAEVDSRRMDSSGTNVRGIEPRSLGDAVEAAFRFPVVSLRSSMSGRRPWRATLGGKARPSRRTVLAATSAVAAVAAGIGLMTAVVHQGPSPSSNCPPVAPRRVDVDGDGCAESIRIQGQIVRVNGVSYRVGRPGDVVAVGDWDCDGRSTPAVLRPSTGEVLAFDQWAVRGTPATARTVARIDGAVSLRADDRGNCARAVVGLSDGTTQIHAFATTTSSSNAADRTSDPRRSPPTSPEATATAVDHQGGS